LINKSLGGMDGTRGGGEEGEGRKEDVQHHGVSDGVRCTGDNGD